MLTLEFGSYFPRESTVHIIQFLMTLAKNMAAAGNMRTQTSMVPTYTCTVEWDFWLKIYSIPISQPLLFSIILCHSNLSFYILFFKIVFIIINRIKKAKRHGGRSETVSNSADTVCVVLRNINLLLFIYYYSRLLFYVNVLHNCLFGLYSELS